MELDKKIIDLSDPEAVRKQLRELAPKKAEEEIKAILEKYQCALVFDSFYRDGSFVHGEIKVVYINGP